MNIGIVTPAPPGTKYGNRVTALRWARILRESGNRISVRQVYERERFGLLIALHAGRSHDSIARFHRDHPGIPIIVALTGTDLYGDLGHGSRALESLRLATRIVALQPKALEELPRDMRPKTRVIYQSVKSTQITGSPEVVASPPQVRSLGRARLRSSGERDTFDVCVIGHLRPVKDPFRAAMATRRLPASSRIRVIHVGCAMNEEAAVRARAEMKTNPRYRWLGEQPAGRVRRILNRSCLFVLSSRVEGGANVLGEAIVAGTPVLASRISGSVGILGEGYAGYFEVGDTNGLASLMRRAETEQSFVAELKKQCSRLVPLFDPAREEAAWAELLGELL
jgi:glycosyltransferase involved in cell wall biosynthesis